MKYFCKACGNTIERNKKTKSTYCEKTGITVDLIPFTRIWTPRKPYNPPSLYKKASIWNKIVWKIKKVIKLLIKKET